MESVLVKAACAARGESIGVARGTPAIGAEVLRPEPGLLLGVERREPLALAEIDPEELQVPRSSLRPFTAAMRSWGER